MDGLTPEEQKGWDDFVEAFRRDALEKIAGAGTFISIVPTSEHFDVKFAAELGAAMFYDMPLIVVTAPGATIPNKIRKVADSVIEEDIDTEEGRLALADALKHLLGKE